jgi:uncharacterized protein (DUF58 family)
MTAARLHQAETLAALLPPLLIEAERVAHAVLQGVHGRRRAGVGETFWQFRPYAQSDAASRIDWRQSARTDKLFVREREWEAAQSAYLWADASGSMHYTSDKNLSEKAARAQLLMLALASLLLRGGERVTWLDERRHITVHGRGGLEQITSRIGEGRIEKSLPPPLPTPRHAHMILCSDFLMPEEDLQKLMQTNATRNVRGVFVHVLDPAEESFSFDGRLEMRGCEGEDPMLLPNAASLRDAYRERMQAHKGRLLQITEAIGWHCIRHITSELPHLALMQVYQHLSDQ